MLKAKQVDLKLHPLPKRLVSFKQILEQLSDLDNVVLPQIDDLLQNGGKPCETPEEPVQKTRKKPQKKLKIIKEKENKVERETKIEELTHDERVALEVYEALKSKKNVADESEEDEQENSKEDEQAMDVEQMDDDDGLEDERRAITYQIAKNKGLQPKRNKLQRNPRVKHRHKFEKAKVRRKGQVREVRKEVKKYGGEVSGINMRVKKGVKLS